MTAILHHFDLLPWERKEDQNSSPYYDPVHMYSTNHKKVDNTLLSKETRPILTATNIDDEVRILINNYCFTGGTATFFYQGNIKHQKINNFIECFVLLTYLSHWYVSTTRGQNDTGSYYEISSRPDFHVFEHCTLACQKPK